MNVSKAGRAGGLALAGVLALTACGGDVEDPVAEATGGGGGATTAEGSIGGVDCAAGSLQASGSSAQENAMLAWISEYQDVCADATVNYQAVGSGAGREQFLQGSTAFAGSDSAIEDEQAQQAQETVCDGNPPINLPMVTGPIAIAYNLEGVDDLVLSGDVLARIFSGQITTWDDPAIAELNPGAQLPSQPIQAVHRSDSSGTTANFTSYLEAVAPDVWTYGTEGEWAAPGGQGAAQSAGVTQATTQADGAITYVEQSFAENAGLAIAQIDTGAPGEPVALTPESAGAAVAAAEVVGEGQDLALELDYATEEEGVYPIVLVTYEVVCSAGNDPSALPLLQSFLGYTASEEGQGILVENGYAPLPDEVRSQVADRVAALS